MQRRLSGALIALCAFVTAASQTPAESPEPRPRNYLLNIKGQAVEPFTQRDAKFFAFIFVAPDCPVSNSYAPEVQRLHAAFAPKGVVFWLVYPDAQITGAAIEEHVKAYAYPCDALRDMDYAFTKRAHVEVTPEAALFRPDGTLLYSGRIDNRYAALGAKRPKATEHDFWQAIEDALAGNPVKPAGGPPVGCFIEGAK